MGKKLSGSLYVTMLMMTVLPVAFLGIAITIFCSGWYIQAIHGQIESELENICNLTLAEIDVLYPGDYMLEGAEASSLRKGNAVLEDAHKVMDQVKEETGIDLTLFYHDTRVLTTIRDENGDRIVGSHSSAIVAQQVYEAGVPGFYARADVMGENYFSYYRPVCNSDGNCVGMMFAGKPSREISRTIRYSFIPAALMIACIVFAAGCICFRWSCRVISHIHMIQDFLTAMSEGRFSAEMNPLIMKRNDEIGRMGNSAVQMQHSIRNLVEKDALTGLNNRRFGIEKLDETQKNARIDGKPFSVALGDIDFFKKINDTYGHDCGDLVLKEVSALLCRHMEGKGFAVRWGGEEFLLVYTRLHAKEAAEHVEEILKEIRLLRIPYGDCTVCLTMSFGVTEGGINEKADVFIKVADDKLYYGKRHGRNQVICRLPEERNGDGMETTSL